MHKNLAELERHHTLVLNADFTVLELIHWRPAVEDVCSGKSYALENHEGLFVHSEKTKMPLPSIVVSRHFHNVWRPAVFTRKNAFIAYWEPDSGNKHWACALCGERMSMSETTFEHVIPRSKGGRSTWDNLVLAHASCNNAKGDNMLHECGMRLHVDIRKPTEGELARRRMVQWAHGDVVVPEEWLDYIGDAYFNTEISP